MNLNGAGIQKSDTKTIGNGSSVRYSSGSDIDENSLVIDLDKMTDTSQDGANDKKMDNVFDRILCDVTFTSASLSRSTVLSKNANTDNPTSLQDKGDCEMKKESNDETVRGLENLEHCLKEFEGKLKQNGSCSKIDGKEKIATQAVDKKTSDDDKKLQEEMDALISEFTTTVDKGQDPDMNKEKTVDNSKTDISVTKIIAVEDKVSEETDANIELEKSSNIVKEMKNKDVYVEGIGGIKKLKMTDTETCVDLNTNIPIVNECCETKSSDEQSNVGNKEKTDEVDNSKCEDSNDKCDEPDDIVDNTDFDQVKSHIPEIYVMPNEKRSTKTLEKEHDKVIEIIKSESSIEENQDILSKNILTFINKDIKDIDNMVVPSYGEQTGNTEGVCAVETKDLASKDGNGVLNRKSEDETFTSGCKKCGKSVDIGSDDESNGKVNETQNQNVVGKKVCETTAPVRKISIVSDETLKQQETTAAWSKLGMQRCENCKFTTDDESLFASHSVICSRKPTKVEVAMVYSEYRFNCLNCQYSSSLRRKFEEHVALHLMAQPYICITCNITFESKKDIEVHVKVKHAKETVKCGLKGPKRIGQIIDVLMNSGKHTFHGRPIDQSLPTDGKQKEKESIQSVGIVPSSTTIPPQSLVQPRATSAASSDTGSSNVVFVSSTATTTSARSLLSSKHNEVTILKSTLPQNTITTQGPLILVPVNNMNGMFIPLSNVQTQPAQPVQASAVIGSASSGNNQLNFQNIPYRFSAQNITIQSNTLQSNTMTVPNTSNSSQMNGPAKTLNIQNTQPRYVILPPGNLPSIIQTSLPVTNQQNNQLMNIPTLIPYNNIESNQRNLVSLLGATAIRPTLVQAQSRNSISLTTPGVSPKSVSNTNAIGISTALPVVTVPQSPTTVLPSTTDSNSGMSVNSSVVDTDGNKLYFRKSGELYMCDFCKSETPLEDSFKEHIWKHFHQMQKICKDCPVPYDSSTTCKIVVKVMMGLLNSALELSTQNQTKDIVMISDDEEDKGDIKERDRNDHSQKDEEKKQNGKEEAVVTIDSGESTPTNEQDLQIKITNTFSLSETDKLNVEKTETSTNRQEDIIKGKNNVNIDKTTADMAKDVFDGKESNATKNDEESPRLPNTVKEKENNYSTVDEKESSLVSSELHKNKCSSEDILKSVEESSITKEKTNTKLNKKTPEYEEHLKSSNEMETSDNIGEREGQTGLQNGSILSISQTTEQDGSPNEDQTNESKCFETLQDPTTLFNCNTVKTIAEHESTIATETDRKPIAFPLVAFYKCGIDSCSFDAATSHEFREHLSQCHRDALEYKCAHCGQKSFTEDSHIRHLLFHSKPQNSLLFHCGVIGCRFRANVLHIYKEHLEQAHENVLLYRCHSCKDGFTSVALLVEHLQNNLLKFVQCPYCTMKDGVRRNVLMHITSFHPGKPRQINVTSQLICQERETNEFEKVFPKLEHQDTSSNEVKMADSAPQHLSNEGKIEDHKSMLSDLTENDPEDTEMINKIISNPSIMGATYYRCNSCTYLGIGHTKLSKHSEMHKLGLVQQSQRTFVCPECPQSVNILQQFISHLNLHVGEHVCYVYICQHCGFGTNLSNKIQQHVTGDHGSNKLGKDYTERTIRFSVKTMFCTKCNAAFKTSQAHRDHVLKSHGITTNEMSGKDDLESQKTQSRKDFHKENKEKHVSPPQLSQHNEEDVSKRRFTCNECGWATRKLSFLKHHVKRHFPTQDRCQITLFKCNYCEFTSTSKLIINGHSQNMHPGKLLRVKRVIETVYITEGDLSIDKFHCDLCTFSCDKVSTLQSHLRDSHSGKKNLDESTKTTYVGPKQEFLIPSGTVFKDVIQCSMCTFRTKRRIELLRHIKIHPSLEPKTETSTAKDQQHSDKVQKSLFESFHKLRMKRKASSDGNPIVKKPCPLSPTMPYDRIKMDAAARDTGYRKQVATKSTTNRGDASIKSMLYFLGGEQLHMKLKPCISEFKDASQYYCLICSDVFEEKFNLHKHILQHMKVHFYKCAYCDHGTLDQTLVMVHIQRMHRRAIQYSKLDVEEIDSHINKAIHDMKSQVGSGKEKITFEEMPKDTKSQLLHKNEKKDELKWIIPDKAKEVTSEKTEDNSMTNGNVEGAKDTTHTKIKQEKISATKQEKVSPIKHFQKENTFKHWGNTGDGTKDIDNDPTRDGSENENVTEIKNNANLMLHVHPKVKSIDDIFKCTICENEFNIRSAANNHIIMHSKVRRFMCSICLFNYVSRWRGDIKKHIDTKHKANNKAECLWDDITPCDLTDDGLPFFEFKYNSKLTPPTLLSEFNTIKKECQEIKEEVQSEIADIKLNCPSKRPMKIKLCLGNKTEKKPVLNFLKMYKCLVCTKTFRSTHAIHQHLRKDCRNPLFGCSLCKFKDVDESKVRKHLKSNHESDDGEVVTRTRNHKIRLYKVPIRSDSSKVSAKSEVKDKKSTTGVLFKCVACKRTFKNRSACWYHAISALCNKTIKKCSQCEFKDVVSEQVESHIKKMHKEKGVKVVELPKEAKIEMITAPSSAKMNRNKTGNITFFFKENGEYKCRICDFKCRDVPSVIQHQNMHNSSPTYGCPYCNVLKSNYTKSVKNHVRLRHPGKLVKVKPLRNDIGTGNRKEVCKETSNTASTKEISLEKKCVMHKCLQCNYRCETYSGLFRHIKRTESCNVPRFKCKECQKYTSLNEIEVVEHMRNVHNSKEMPEICPIKEMMKIIKVKKKSSEDSSKVIKTDKNDRTDKSRIIEKFSGMKDIETQVITCPKVSCNFKDKVIKVLEHYRKDHPTRIMKCKMCHFSSKSLGIMFMHFKDFHKLEDYYSTSFLVCAKTREEKERADAVEKNQTEKNALFKSYKCNRCTYAAYNRHGMRIHLYRHLNYKRFLCRLCKADFIIRPYVEKHLTVVHSTDSEEVDEIKNERIEKEVEDILEKSIVWKQKEGLVKDQDRSPTQNKIIKKENSKPELKKTTDSKKEKIKEELESVDKTGLKKHNSETTLKLKVDFTKFGTDVFNQSNYIKEVQNRKTKEMEYLCTKCPYKSIARHCALGHTYKHMPKCMKCPYCNFHGYPR